MADQARARKLADRIKVVVAETLERRVKDPRLGFVTVTDARVGSTRPAPGRAHYEEDDVADQARARKLADRIKVVVAETLERRVKDPRLGFVTVTDARVTGDLREATVFYTVYGDDTERADTATALESVKGLVRSEVGRQTGVRFTPTLAFVADALPDNARQIEDLLRRARESDAELARGAAGAQFAGDPDPYRLPLTGDEAAETEATRHETAGAETAGAETAGAETAGAETAGAETAGAETAGAAAADDLQDGRPA